MMTRAFSVAAAVAVASLASACGTSASLADSAMGGAGGAGGGDASDGFGATSITFAESSIVFVPGKTRTVRIQVAPAGSYTVHLALLGDALDAYLDRSQVETDAEGAASFSLTAPSSPTSFSIRASVGRVSAEATASAVPNSTTQLRLVPAYTGHRKITSWTGTVSVGGTCDPSAMIPPTDGSLVAEAPDAPVVANVPLGTPLVVTVRAGHFAGGCVMLPGIVEVDAGTAGSVTVPAADRPLSMGGVSIPVKLGISTSSGWIAGWTALSSQMASSFSPDGGTDASALLDAMHDATPTSSQTAFTDARTTGAWDAALALNLHDVLAAHALRAVVERWLGAALPVLATDAIEGTLVSSTTAPFGASLTVTSVGGVSPSDAGVPADMQSMSWTTAPDDHVLFGGTTKAFSPSALAAALSLAPAEADVPAAKSVEVALANVVGCQDVATVLAGSSGAAYPGCDSACAAKRCEVALTAMWARAKGAVTSSGLLDFSASCAVSAVSDTAAPVTLDGTWVGDVHLGASVIHAGGPALGGPHPASKP